MCGIFGIISRHGNARSDLVAKIAKTLREGLTHRGPDGASITIVDDYCLLGHTRLAINDISGGVQPFSHSSLEGVTSIINGEIYNYMSIRNKIHSETFYRLDTRSDCEPLAYFMLGLVGSQVPVPEGMYAGAVYDKKDRRLYLSRDVFGEKPLYLYMGEEIIVFSSEVNALARSIGAKQLSEEAIIQFMLYGYTVGNGTVYEGIRQIKAGTLYTVNSQNWSLVVQDDTWGSPNTQLDCDRELDVMTLIEESLMSYVQQSTLSDVPICIGLSGGLDSTLIAALNRDKIRKAFTVTYEASGGTDELADAKNTANYLGIDHEAIMIRNEEVAQRFVDQVRRKDSPIVDVAGVGYAALYERMNQQGYKVALMGHGGDELFMGYPWLYQSLGHNLNRSPKQSMIYETLPDFRQYFRLLPFIFGKAYKETYRWNAFRPVSTKMQGGYASTFDLVRQYWLEPNSLKMGDALSMSFSVESRHPLLSYRLYSLLSESEPSYIFPEAKWALRSLVNKLLPIELVQREKRYFSPPYLTYYSLISAKCSRKWKENQVLRQLGMFTESLLNRFYMEDFKGDAFDYYLFPKLATLDLWMSR